MKTKHALSLSIFLVLVSQILAVQTLKAQNAPAINESSESIKLSGNAVKTEDIALKCDAVFVGEITEMGFPTPTSPGVASYGAKIKVLHILRGSIAEQISVRIDTFAKNNENPPKVGSSYIFFVHKEDTRFRVLKLLPATDANITKVKALIAATPAGK